MGYESERWLGPGEIVEITADGYTQLRKPNDKMQVCSFLWVYFGYPTCEYEGKNVEEMRYDCGEEMGKNDDVEVDFVSGIPDSGIGMSLGYAIGKGVPYKRAIVKYTPTWPRSFTPTSQERRELVAKMKLIPNKSLLKDMRVVFCDDSIVRGTQLRDNIRDLYRFFKLNRHRVDFNNPFEGVLNLADINVLEDDLSDSELLSLISEFYFKRKFYSEALIAFNKLESIQPPSAQLYQKMGFAMQQLGDINAALRYFEQAELFDGENIWTLKHIAVCYKQKQNYAQAIEYFKRVELLLPEDISVAINIGNCLVAVASYDEAIKYFHKVEYLSEDPSTAWRKLAWCLLMIKDYKQSELYYQKVIGASPQAMDYMNLGHLYFVNLDYKQAVLMYCKCYESLGDKQRFIDTFNNDLQYLKGLNVNMELVPFMLDEVFYNDNN